MSRTKRSDLGRRGLLPRPSELLAYGLHLGFEGKEAAQFVRPDAPAATVNDWKTEAMEKGLLEPPTWPEGVLAPEVELRIREKYHHEPWRGLEEKLRKASGGVFHELWVFPDGGATTSFDLRLRRFARNSSWWLAEQLASTRSGVAVVAWGKTLGACGEALVRRSRGRLTPWDPCAPTVTVVPCVGESLGDPDSERVPSATAIARMFAAAFASPGPVPTLDNIPSVIPRSFSEPERLVVKRFLAMMCSYAAVFEGDDAWIRRADVSITSVGSFKQSWLSFISPSFKKGQNELSRSYMESLFDGDIGGYPIPSRRPGLPPAAAQDQLSIQDAWTSVRIEHFQRIAGKAGQPDDDGPAGSVVLALDENKANSTSRAVAERAVTRLGCDPSLAAALDKKF